jgi:hypothetical protein
VIIEIGAYGDVYRTLRQGTDGAILVHDVAQEIADGRVIDVWWYMAGVEQYSAMIFVKEVDYVRTPGEALA